MIEIIASVTSDNVSKYPYVGVKPGNVVAEYVLFISPGKGVVLQSGSKYSAGDVLKDLNESSFQLVEKITFKSKIQ